MITASGDTGILTGQRKRKTTGKMTTQEQNVLLANDSFYSAFKNRDLQSMDRLWSARDGVAVIHPGWPAVTGRDAVLSSWKRILEGGMSPSISCVDAKANILGETAVVICTEVLTEAELVATNIFVQERGKWKMVHHQAGPLSANAGAGDGETLH